MTTPALVEHFFRHEYGRLVAVLSRRVGVQHLEAVEDAVQSAMMVAVESWAVQGLPDNPSAWLFRVANNHVTGALRQGVRRRLLLEHNGPNEAQAVPAESYFASEMQDDLLRMLFVCCDEAIPAESQLVLALKTLCGFDVREIALRLFTSEANVYKRLARARERLREVPPHSAGSGEEGPREPAELWGAPSTAQYESRLNAVQRILYLLFTEGYLSSHAEDAIRRELCADAIRLTTILAEHPAGQTPETFALLALMHLHAARMTSRQDDSGGLLLLEEQDRALWNPAQIQIGLHWLSQSAQGDTLTRYHAEAGIAAEHCLAPSFAATRWEKVAEYYELLERRTPSPLHRLNRAVAIAESQGPEAGLALLDGAAPPTWLQGSYLWAAVLADLHSRCGHRLEAERHRSVALRLAPTSAVRQLLQRRLGPAQAWSPMN